ncbi:hypothetical protein Tco_1204472 [Tanacetum coccineum]
MAANGNGDDGPPPAGGGDLPVPDLRTMEELCQPTLNVQNSCPFRGLGDDANKHLDKFLHVTQSMEVNGVSDDALRLYLFPYSLQHRVAEWFDRLARNFITTCITPKSGVAYTWTYRILILLLLLKVVETLKLRRPKDTVPPILILESEDVQPPVVQVETHVPISEHVKAPVSAPKPNPKPSIPYPSRLKDKKLREKANNQMEKFYQIFSRFAFRH